MSGIINYDIKQRRCEQSVMKSIISDRSSINAILMMSLFTFIFFRYRIPLRQF